MQAFIACIYSKCCFENIFVESFASTTYPFLCVLLPVFLHQLCCVKAFLLNTCITCPSQISHLVYIIQKLGFAANLFLFGSFNHPFVKVLNKHFFLPWGYTKGFPQSHLIVFLKTVFDHSAWKKIKARHFLCCDTVFHAVTGLLSCSLCIQIFIKTIAWSLCILDYQIGILFPYSFTDTPRYYCQAKLHILFH